MTLVGNNPLLNPKFTNFWEGLSLKDLPPDPLFEELETDPERRVQTPLSKRNFTQFEPAKISSNPQQPPSVDKVRQIANRSNPPYLPSTSEKDGMQTRSSKRKLTQVEPAKTSPALQQPPSIDKVQQIAKRSNPPSLPSTSEKDGVETRSSKRNLTEVEPDKTSPAPQKTPSLDKVPSPLPQTSESSGVQTRLSKRKLAQVEPAKTSPALQQPPSIDKVQQIAKRSNPPSLPSTSESSGVQTRSSKRKLTQVEPAKTSPPKETSRALANTEIQAERIDEDRGEKGSAKKQAPKAKTSIEKQEIALKSLRENPTQSWDLLCRNNHIKYSKFAERAEAEGFQRNRVGGKPRKDVEAIDARSNQAMENLREAPHQSWNALVLKSRIPYPMLAEKAKAEGFTNYRGRRAISDSEKEAIEVKMNQALEDLKANPNQGWVKLAKSYHLSVDRFFERAEAAGIEKNAKSVSLTIDKADIDNRTTKALKALESNPTQSWGALARKHHLGYDRFAAKAEEEGFTRNPTGLVDNSQRMP